MPSQSAFERLKAAVPTLSCGLMSADLANLSAEIQRLESTDLAMLHFDVMDGCFVPIMTAGPLLVKAARTSLLKDVHLMVLEPFEKVEAYVRAGADIVVCHAESCEDLRPTLEKLGTLENANDPARGIVRGAAINPDTPVAALKPLLDLAEVVVVLAVIPGVSSKFIDSTGERVRQVKEMIRASGREILVCIDGGVTQDNVGEVAALGADFLVSGSAMFKNGRLEANTAAMLEAVRGPNP